MNEIGSGTSEAYIGSKVDLSLLCMSVYDQGLMARSCVVSSTFIVCVLYLNLLCKL